MPRFSYIVKDKEGKTYRDVIDALNEGVVIEKLQQQGYFVVTIKEVSSVLAGKIQAALRPKRKFARRGIRLQDLLIFSRQLGTMLEAGVTLTRALDVIQAQVESERFSRVLERVKKDVEQGASLSLALSQHPKIFNQFWVSLVEVGEASGTVPVVLDKLTFHLEQQASFRSTIVSNMIYPSILCCLAMGAILVFALFIGPRFEEVFKSMQVKLPLLTVILLNTFKFIKINLFLLLAGITAGIFLFRQYFKTLMGKVMIEKFLFRLPKIGEIYKLIVVERFTSQMSILIDSGVPILYALDITERLVNNYTCARIIVNIKERVREGELLVAPMERSGFFPPMATQMISVGEETGELSKMLKHVSEYYQESVSTFMKRSATIIEPVMLVFMGVVIGTIVIAMFLPMFNIAQLGGAGGG